MTSPMRTTRHWLQKRRSDLAFKCDKCLLLNSQFSRNSVHNFTGDRIKEAEHPKYLGVMLSRNGMTRKDVTERLNE